MLVKFLFSKIKKNVEFFPHVNKILFPKQKKCLNFSDVIKILFPKQNKCLNFTLIPQTDQKCPHKNKKKLKKSNFYNFSANISITMGDQDKFSLLQKQYIANNLCKNELS
jgi:hypothetical protein